MNNINENHEVKLVKYSSGELRTDNFAVVKTSIPELKPDEVLIRNRWFRVSISTRFMAKEDAKAVDGIPFPPLKLNDTLSDGAIGEVVSAGENSGLVVGDMVMHPFGWREYAVATANQCTSLGQEEVDPIAWLGHGWTAYAALTAGIQIQKGDTVFVTSGAGAIGSMAGQIARLLGAKRVIGSTSTDKKAQWMKTTLGYDAVVTRSGSSMREQLMESAPDGIDVIVDMVGGEQLSMALELCRQNARCILLGALSAELNPQQATLNAPVQLDSFQLILKGITMRGFSACEQAPSVFEDWKQQLKTWKKEGKIYLPHTAISGLDNAPFALQEACAGRLKGVVLVEL